MDSLSLLDTNLSNESATYETFGHNETFVRRFLSGNVSFPEVDILQYDKNAFARVCRRFGLEVPKEFYDNIEIDHIVEIFDLSGRSLYKNLYYFQFSNYSIDEHLNRSFFELFSRPAEIEKQIMDYLTVAFTEKDYSLKHPAIPFHYLKEKESNNKSIFGLDIKSFQLIRHSQTKELYGFANMIRVTEYKMDALS